jgi:hypothetical protein
VFAEARVASINALGSRRFSDLRVFIPLVWIEQPFIVRHAAIGVFRRRGCDKDCISAALYSLHGLWAGRLTAEQRLAAEHPDFSSRINSAAAPLRSESESDYFALLSMDPCAARDHLQIEYRSEPAFVEQMKTKLGGQC